MLLTDMAKIKAAVIFFAMFIIYILVNEEILRPVRTLIRNKFFCGANVWMLYMIA